MQNIGEVAILNVGNGDTKISFDPSNPQECIRAARIVKDMIRRGYCLLVAVPGREGEPPTYRRAYDFDENTHEYIIADLDPDAAQAADEQEAASAEQETTATETQSPTPKRGRPTKRVAASTARTVSVPRTAGG